MAAGKLDRRRCAIYTRKSTDEGLEQDFNSLDAQREACEAYIRSQVGEGWEPVRTRYDDGAYSGGNMERPALRQLLTDISSGKIDTVVVYKVDRLTRSLADFAKIVEVFDGHGVSFVSITQQFNTTTSMGRLTLNMLLSFAQFEREVTGERIRDKIAASKKKGMWMGGLVPLGYEPDGRTLAINEAEAATVRTVFRLYLEHGNVRRVKAEADRLGHVTKIRSNVHGRCSGGRPLSRGYIYSLLGNPLYIGRIAHKGETYEGQHSAIIDRDTWDAVQAKLASNAQQRLPGVRATESSPLRSKLFDETGTPLTPSHAVKGGRRYRYYVSRRLLDGTAADGANSKKWRLPAREIERIVADALQDLIANRAALAGALRESGTAADRVAGVLEATARWKGGVLDLVTRIDLEGDGVGIKLDLSAAAGGPTLVVRHIVPVQMRRRGVEMRLILEGAGSAAAGPDPALIKAVVRAHKWYDDLLTGRARSLRDIARKEGISNRYVSRLIVLAFLAPDIVEALLEGSHPGSLTAEALSRHIELPLSWIGQRETLSLRRMGESISLPS